jgi:hypothetical protein
MAYWNFEYGAYALSRPVISFICVIETDELTFERLEDEFVKELFG